MKVGRELDALIAEKVMDGTEGVDGIWKFPTWYGTLPFYSTNIADAWLIMDKFGTVVQLTKWSGGYDCKVAGVPTVTAETAPLSICLAALKAVGVEV